MLIQAYSSDNKIREVDNWIGMTTYIFPIVCSCTEPFHVQNRQSFVRGHVFNFPKINSFFVFKELHIKRNSVQNYSRDLAISLVWDAEEYS